jgi:hypothetical protein
LNKLQLKTVLSLKTEKSIFDVSEGEGANSLLRLLFGTSHTKVSLIQLVCLTEKSIFDVSEGEYCEFATETAIRDASRESFVNE